MKATSLPGALLGASCLVLCLGAPARADDCASFDAAALDALVGQARAALFADDLAGVQAAHATLVGRAPCIDWMVEPRSWAPHLVTLSIAAYAQNEDWQSPLSSALLALPTVDRGVGEAHPIAAWRVPAMQAGEPAQLQSGVRLALDGRATTYLSTLTGPHLLQVSGPDGVRTAVVDGDGSAGAWEPLLEGLRAEAAPEAAAGGGEPLEVPTEPTPRRGRGWLVAGGVTAGVGIAAGATGWAVKDAGIDQPELRPAITVANVGGWSLAGVGAGLLAVGFAHSLNVQGSIGRGSASLVLQGRL